MTSATPVPANGTAALMAADANGVRARQVARRQVCVRVVDSPLVEAGVRALLAVHRDRFSVLGARPDASWASLAAGADVLLCDAELPETALGELLRTGVPVALLAWSDDPRRARRPLAAGAATVLPKSIEPGDLMTALERLAASEPVAVGTTTVPDGAALGREWGLTPREEEILALLAQGFANRGIAERSFVSVNTVKTHLRSLYQKLGVANRAQAVRWWFDHRDPDDEAPPDHPSPAPSGTDAAYGGEATEA